MEKKISKTTFIITFTIIIIQILYYLIIQISEIEYFRYTLRYYTPDFINKYRIEYLIISYEVLLLSSLFIFRIKAILRLLQIYYTVYLVSIIYFLMDSYFYGCGCEIFFKTTNFTSLFFSSLAPFLVTYYYILNLEKPISSKKILIFIRNF